MGKINEDAPVDGEREKPEMDVTRKKYPLYYIRKRVRGEVKNGDAGQGEAGGIFTGFSS